MQWPLFVEETLFDTVLYRESVGLNSVERIPGRVSILRFRHLLETHHLPEQILATVNAALTNKGLMKLEFGPSAIIPEAGVYHDLGGFQGRPERKNLWHRIHFWVRARSPRRQASITS